VRPTSRQQAKKQKILPMLPAHSKRFGQVGRFRPLPGGEIGHLTSGAGAKWQRSVRREAKTVATSMERLPSQHTIIHQGHGCTKVCPTGPAPGAALRCAGSTPQPPETFTEPCSSAPPHLRPAAVLPPTPPPLPQAFPPIPPPVMISFRDECWLGVICRRKEPRFLPFQSLLIDSFHEARD
jgi:hypothetical protein